MEFGQRDVIDLKIYDEDGNEVAALDFLNGSIYKNKDNTLTIYTDILSTQLLDFLYSKEDDLTSDFDSYFKNKDFDTYDVNKERYKKCKLIATTNVKDGYTQDYKDLIYVIPNAEVETKFDLFSSNEHVSKYQIVFHIKPFNDRGNLFQIKLEKKSILEENVTDSLFKIQKTLDQLSRKLK